MKVLHVVGARPNFMKTAPIMAAMAERPGEFDQVLVHTGQHYDQQMSTVFFEELGLPVPDEFLGVGSGTHAEQTARTMLAFEPVLQKHRPDWVLVVGDVNSTLACTLVASKMAARVAHVEAGLRSGDRSMPEEINRIVTDKLADLLFIPARDGEANLLREGIGREKIRFVGNVMIDTLVRLLPVALQRPILSELGLEPGGFLLVTLHRPGNVDAPETLAPILAGLKAASGRIPVVFPVHPRTRQRIESTGPGGESRRIRFLEPLGYLDFLALMHAARLVITDSGGVQEETTFLGVPCLTVRPNTERPITVSEGTNRLVPPSCEAIDAAVQETLANPPRRADRPELWDGRAAERIVAALLEEATRD